MSSDHNSSCHHEIGMDGHQTVAQMTSSENQDLKEWLQEYMAVDGNHLAKDSDVIQAVKSDELDADFVEQRIRELAPEAPNTQGFCTKCQCLFDNWPTIGGSSTREHDSRPDPNGGGWEHAVARPCNTFELEASTRSGCRFCAFLLQSLKDTEILDTFRKIEARLYHLNENATSSLSIQNWGTNPIQLLWLNLPGTVCTSCNAGIAADLKFESCFLPASADCYDDPLNVLDIASNWLSTCSANHELCKSSNDGPLPSRLVSIAGESPRLVLVSGCTEKPRYATLSHSWGSHDIIKLTSENLDLLMRTLPVEKLPKTFKDAIEIAQRLGLDYLWVDSLCIVQDSEDDWQKESARMHSVYGGSVITIAASSAQDGSEGCFLKPPHFSGGLRARITDGGKRRVQDFRSSELYNLSTYETHLGSRAWALQEKMLPPRTIHFGDRGAFWECRTTIASEYLPDGFPKQLVSPLVRRKGKFEWLWLQIVQIYSAANLTFGKDKLPALSGIASLGHNETGDQYLAGLWRRQVEEQLCWRRSGSQTAGKRPAWRAPSWSWASVDGGVTWYTRQKGVLDTQYAHVLDASTTQDSYNPFGQITGGLIRLACCTIAAGYLIQSKESNKPGVVLKSGNQEQEFPIKLDCLDDGDFTNNGLIYLLPIFCGSTGRGRTKDGENTIWESMIEGIVLRATGVTKGEFSRIGSFNIYKDEIKYGKRLENEDVEKEYYEPFLSVLKDHGTKTAEAACAEVISNPDHPDERYVVTLV
ncbi:hypothetical protein EG329_009738 [Mollisiaceae sp. DMI_Dod_QoI]|nr:hypothetical protein EG329_009738 [Helotiales sp. DMI_Dod_QoI]